MPEPELIFVDLETSGLSPDADWAVEAGWRNLNTGDEGVFVPIHPVENVLRFGDPAALRINRYRERLQHADQDHGLQDTTRLYAALAGQTLVAANPAFDASFLIRLFHRAGFIRTDPWHHRLWDIEAYACGVLALRDLPSMSDICHLLGIAPGDHSAGGDVAAGSSAFHELRRRNAARSILRKAS